MSKFFSQRYNSLIPYTPGEQPRDCKYVKLNTNESPYPPSKAVVDAVSGESGKLQLYSDPECTELRDMMSRVFGIDKNRIIMSNGSDEILNFAFMAFADENSPLAFPDITYGFYPVFAQLNHIPYKEIPLKEDFSVDVEAFCGNTHTVVIANPNAPTGMLLPLDNIEYILKCNPDRVVIVDEAYIDFGGESAISLVDKYENLIVVGTFSKSRSMAGARLGFAFANENLIGDLNTIRYSTNPYNINRMTSAAGCAALSENSYYMENCREIIKTRGYFVGELRALGFDVLPSSANFVFAKSDLIGGEELYTELKKNGILIRHFSLERIKDYNRITIGTKDEMDILICAIKKIIKGATQ